MSATIPSGMLLSDLLKATGYDCPSTLAGKTFAQATAGAGIDLEANKASSVNVGEYTQPIEITPSTNYEAMEKVTLTLTGIISKLYAFGTADKAVYLTAIPAEDGTVDVYTTTANGITKGSGTYAEATGVTVNDTAYVRYASGDIEF